jgi:outer membrane protein
MNMKMKKLILCAVCAICGFTTANAQKFGHVNTQEIIQAMPEYATAKTEIDKLQAQYEADLKSMQDELQKKADAFDKEQATLPDNIKQRRQTELQEMYQKIQQSYQDNQQALQKASSEKMQAITAKVLDAIKAVGQAGDFVIINEINAGIPYISTTLSTDVTAQVKTKLGLK